MPSSPATSMTRRMARPITTTSRPAAWAASAIDRSRPTLDAEGGEGDAARSPPGRSRRVSRATSVSLGLRPSRMALVESQTSASTPSSPIAWSRATSVGSAERRRSSSFQSPLWRTTPSGVRIASACDSGMEWVTLMYSTSNGPTVKRSPGVTIVIGTDLGAGLAGDLCHQQVGGEGRRVDRHAQPRPQVDQRAEMILVGVGDDDADEVRALLLEIGDVGEDRDRRRAGRLGEGDAEIDRQPGAVVARTDSRRGRDSCRSRRPRRAAGRPVRPWACANAPLRSAGRREEHVARR